jgi:hypothetical protein
MGFCSLQHAGSEVHLMRGLPARYVPPSGFGHPLDGFLPSIPCRFCFAPAALMGFTLRSFLLPKGIRTFPSGRTHLPFLPPVIPCAEHKAGSAGRGSWVLALPGVPDDTCVISAPAAGCSPGFRPSRARREDLDRDFARPPPTRFGVHPAPRSLDQSPLRPICSRGKPRGGDKPTL